MANSSLLIRGGTVVDAEHSYRADVLCVDGRINAIGEYLNAPAGAAGIDPKKRPLQCGQVDLRSALVAFACSVD